MPPFSAVCKKKMGNFGKREGRTDCSVCDGMQTQEISEQKNNRPLQVKPENGRSIICKVLFKFGRRFGGLIVLACIVQVRKTTKQEDFLQERTRKTT